MAKLFVKLLKKLNNIVRIFWGILLLIVQIYVLLGNFEAFKF